MLKEIREFLSVTGPSEVPVLARHLGADETAVQAMLEFLEQREQVHRVVIECGGGCGGCGGGSACGSQVDTRRGKEAKALEFWAAGNGREEDHGGLAS